LKKKPEPKSTADVLEGNPNIQVEITDPSEFHCFRLTLNPKAAVNHDPNCDTIGLGPDLGPSTKPCNCGAAAPTVEIMFHARSLVDLIHKCSLALSDWQAQTTDYLLTKMGVKRL